MLSGGQKQPLAIARRVISNPRILVLDEATSALDANAERIVQQALNNVAMGRTMIVIAQRPSTIRDTDNILVMSKGTIVEQGTHSELVEFGGADSRLALAQDLGQDGNREEAEQETTTNGSGEKMAVTKTMSGASRQDSDPEVANTAVLDYNLRKCLAIIMEQRRLWFPFAIIGIAAAVGGAYFSCHPCRIYSCHPVDGTYPALAVLFSRVLDAFALTGDAMLQRGDFYSLMFLVMALGNIVAYGVLCWMSAIVSQVLTKIWNGHVVVEQLT